MNDQLSLLKLGQREIFDFDKHILTNNIFGVDLNSESVEITKLSLWLKTAIKGKELTALDENIKCGNSLIDDTEVAGAKAFNWFTEFPQVFQHYKAPKSIIPIEPEPGDKDFLDEVHEPSYSYKPKSKGFEKYGFDVIVGNPPYGATFNDQMIEYISKNFDSYEYQVNSYVLFYERGINILKQNGILGYITPNTFTYQHYFDKIRTLINKYQVIKICKNQFQVFEDADIGDTICFIIKKHENNFELPVNIKICKNITDFQDKDFSTINIGQLISPDNTYNLNDSTLINIDKIYKQAKPLKELTQIIVGVKAYQTGKGNPKQTKQIVENKIFTSNYKVDNTYIKCVNGKDFFRYSFINDPEMYLRYGEWLAEPRFTAPFFNDEKIIIRQTSDELICHLDKNKWINLNNVYNIGKCSDVVQIRFILSLLNSKLLNFIYQSIAQEKGKLFAEVKKVYLEKLPIKLISLNEQQNFISLVDIMLLKNKELFEIKEQFIKVLLSKFEKISHNTKIESWHTLSFPEFSKELNKQKIILSLPEQSEWLNYFEQEKAKADSIKKIISDTDTLINNMVYELYGLTENEINIIESENENEKI